MKGTKIFMIMAIAAVITLAFAACDDGTGKGDGKIDPNPKVTWPTGLKGKYGQKLSAIALDTYTNKSGTAGAFSWTTPTDSVGALGTTQSHNMTFTPTDTEKYNTVKKDVEVTIPEMVAMIFVPGGSFEMGENLGTVQDTTHVDVTPVHTVTLSSGFFMGKYEITQAEYETVIKSLPSAVTSGAFGSREGKKCPVQFVSWYDALVFCNKLSVREGLTPAYSIGGETDPDEWGTVPTATSGTTWDVEVVSESDGYRLPTEAQWEYAAKGGDPTATGWVGYTYAGSDDPGKVAWYVENNTPSGIKEVGTKAPNGLGIYDMSGNVVEWCWDWYGDYLDEEQTDPTGASSGSNRVRRGGFCNNQPQFVRSAYRDNNAPYYRDYYFGFRLVRPAQ